MRATARNRLDSHERSTPAKHHWRTLKKKAIREGTLKRQEPPESKKRKDTDKFGDSSTARQQRAQAALGCRSGTSEPN
jgi:hypothetical protein